MIDDPRVDRLLEELLESGGSPEEACRSCPELLPQVRAGLLRLRLLDQEVGAMFPSSDSPVGIGPAAPPTGELPRIPGYEVEGELGCGGVGVVYRAHHLRLGRTVALKMLLAGPYARPEERERFLREAQALAALSHPNIVQVHEVAELDGLPHFTMEYVEGGSLAQKLAGTPLPPREAAGLSATLAGAVEAAHRSGIVHRDLKPANVLLAADGTPKITDFGLARRLEAGAGLTQTGFPMGTPSYMAPEQARGETRAIGPGVDVYALGAILYELLTGRPPFRAETPTETVHQVIYQEPAPPSRLNAKVPRDLETICLKCLEKDPRRRYPTAQALADDLHAWLEGRPMAARRVGAAERAWLWCRRKPAIAALAAAVVLAVVGGTATTIAVQAAANRRLDRKNAELSDALRREAKANAELKDANSRVEARYDLAVEAIKTFHTGVSEDFLLNQDQFNELQDRLLTSAADFYGMLSALLKRETDAASRRALAAANFELASLTGMVGRKEGALAAHRAVLAAREALAAEPGAGVAAQADVGRSLTEVARLLEATGQTGDALATYRRAEALLAGTADSDPAARAALADCRSWLGYFLLTTGKHADALAVYRLARAAQESLADAPGAPADARRDLASTINRIGLLLNEMGRPAEAEAEYRRALAIRQKLDADHPAVTESRSHLAGSHNNLANLLSTTGRPAEAEAEYRKALAIQRSLVDDHSAVTDFRDTLARSHNNLANLLSRTGRQVEAEAEHRRALAIRQKLVEDHPAFTDFRSRLAGSHNNLGFLLTATGRPAEAEADYRRALRIREKLAADNPKVPGYRNDVASCHTNLSVILRRLGRLAEARDGCDKAIAIREALVKEFPKVPLYRSYLAWSHRYRGLARRDLGDFAGAAADARRALALWDSLPSRTGEEWFETACARAALAGLAGRDGSDVSAAEADVAMALLRQAVGMGYRNLDAFRTEDALDPLRGRDDFRVLLNDLAFPTDPFAYRLDEEYRPVPAPLTRTAPARK
jgi:tetratricopeptide (TPR) repeat protein